MGGGAGGFASIEKTGFQLDCSWMLQINSNRRHFKLREVLNENQEGIILNDLLPLTLSHLIKTVEEEHYSFGSHITGYLVTFSWHLLRNNEIDPVPKFSALTFIGLFITLGIRFLLKGSFMNSNSNAKECQKFSEQFKLSEKMMKQISLVESF